MILRSILGKIPIKRLTQNPVRHFVQRPTIKISKDLFELTLDVHKFKKDEIRVKAHPAYILIEGKHEQKFPEGHIMRQFTRKYRLPEGCNIKTIESKLSTDGILTIRANRTYTDITIVDETLITITDTLAKHKTVVDEDEDLGKRPDPCSCYSKVQPNENKK